ncbi:hypothetical protein VPH35_123976 [Triticum aestivum]|uniref:Uncharacterized protein n=1 Tax=Triticum urartu TaxID=4572 RepID=A0A8R7V7V8_TRIUA
MEKIFRAMNTEIHAKVVTSCYMQLRTAIPIPNNDLIRQAMNEPVRRSPRRSHYHCRRGGFRSSASLARRRRTSALRASSAVANSGSSASPRASTSTSHQCALPCSSCAALTFSATARSRACSCATRAPIHPASRLIAATRAAASSAVSAPTSASTTTLRRTESRVGLPKRRGLPTAGKARMARWGAKSSETSQASWTSLSQRYLILSRSLARVRSPSCRRRSVPLAVAIASAAILVLQLALLSGTK